MPYWLELIFERRDSIETTVGVLYPRLLPRLKQNNVTRLKIDDEQTFVFTYKSRTLYVKEVLTDKEMPSLSERLKTPPITTTKRIFSESDFQSPNLGGCPDWKCEITKDPSKAYAFINGVPTNKNFTGYVLFSTQESPVNFGIPANGFGYNMSIGFRHDSPTSSPYGYTVLLGKQSWRNFDETVDKSLINGKTKGATWLVSHCITNSKRELLVKKLQKYMEVDIYGGCGTKKCPKGNKCENSINTDYHFYLALENSVCKDYITEKVWNQGYGYTVVPIVLSRKLIEPYVPPGSFIAFDDYKSIKEMATHLKQLMNNKTEYMKYFEWKKKYEVIFLDGLNHDKLERPWGLCQLCRLLHLNALPNYTINDLQKYWSGSCEEDGKLASKLLG